VPLTSDEHQAIHAIAHACDRDEPDAFKRLALPYLATADFGALMALAGALFDRHHDEACFIEHYIHVCCDLAVKHLPRPDPQDEWREWQSEEAVTARRLVKPPREGMSLTEWVDEIWAAYEADGRR
jgi:hypothetical protein